MKRRFWEQLTSGRPPAQRGKILRENSCGQDKISMYSTFFEKCNVVMIVIKKCFSNDVTDSPIVVVGGVRIWGKNHSPRQWFQLAGWAGDFSFSVAPPRGATGQRPVPIPVWGAWPARQWPRWKGRPVLRRRFFSGWHPAVVAGCKKLYPASPAVCHLLAWGL